MDFNDELKTIESERIMEYSRWGQEIPYIKFSPEWEVQIIPPFGGAVARFRIKKGNASLSVYLDCYDRLGCYGQPYWEIYPYDEDVFRCDMTDTDNLLSAINESLTQQLR